MVLDIARFFAEFKPVFFKKGEALIGSDQSPDGIYYLREGFVKMNAVFENGRELTLNIYKPGSYFPMFWALANIPNSYYFQAITDASLYLAPKEKVIKYIQKNPAVLMELTNRILNGVNVLLNNIGYLLSGSSLNRVGAALLLSARRFGESDGRKTVIKVPFIQQDIANLAGLTRETTSMVISRFQKQRIIGRRGRLFVVLDMRKLEEEVHLPDDETSVPNTL